MSSSAISSSGPYVPRADSGARPRRRRGARVGEHEPVAGVDDAPAEGPVVVPGERDRVGGPGPRRRSASHLAELGRARLTTASEIADAGPEHVDARAAGGRRSPPRSARAACPRRSTGRGRRSSPPTPAAGIANAGALGRRHDHRAARAARGHGVEAVDGAGERGGVRALEVGRLERRRPRRVCRRGRPGRRRPGRAPVGAERVERRLRGVGHAPRRRTAAPARAAGGSSAAAAEIAARQSVGVDERDDRGPGLGASARVDRLRRRPPRRRSGRRRPRAWCSWSRRPGKPSALGRLFVVARLADDGLPGVAAGVVAVPRPFPPSPPQPAASSANRSMRRIGRADTTRDTLAVVQLVVRTEGISPPRQNFLNFRMETDDHGWTLRGTGVYSAAPDAEFPESCREAGDPVVWGESRLERREARALSAPARQLTP